MHLYRHGRCAALLLACLFGGMHAQAQSEDGVKCAFLFNFAKFTEWPATAFKSPSAPVAIGFVGGGALAQTFEQAVRGKNANGRDFVVTQVTSASSAGDCQMIYVADAGQAAAVLAAIKGKPVLAIGDVDNLLETGGMIRFVRDGAKIVFDLNLEAAAAAGLKLDAKLGKIARTVKGG